MLKSKILCVSLLVSISTCFAGKIDISGLNKKELLKKLYQNAQPKDAGFRWYVHNDELNDSVAEQIINQGHIGFLRGRLMQVNLLEQFLETELYNQGNGHNAAENVIAQLRGNS